MNRTDWQQLADVRIAEAIALLNLNPPMPDGAYYLAGYAVECALKACIAKTYNQHDWPERQFVNKSHTHDLTELVVAAGLDVTRKADTDGNPALAQNWLIVEDWSERSRYKRHSQADAQRLINAVNDAINGVLPWVKVHW